MKITFRVIQMASRDDSRRKEKSTNARIDDHDETISRQYIYDILCIHERARKGDADMRVNGSKSRILWALMVMLTFGLGRVMSGGIDTADHAHHDHSENGIHVEDGGTLTRGLSRGANSDTFLLNDDEDEEFVRDGSWIELTQAYINATGTLPGGSSVSDALKYYLTGDVTAPANLSVSSGTHVVLDLNGFTLTGNGSGSVISLGLLASLTLQDNSESEDGAITGGNNLYGGGIYMQSATLTIEGGSITGNTATTYGGGIYATAGSEVLIYGGTISHNTVQSTGGWGGGIYLAESSTLTQYGGIVSDNTAYIRGGGLFINDSTATIWNATYSGNTAGSSSYTGGAEYAGTTVKGGGISLWGSSNLVIYDGVYANNSAIASTETTVYLASGGVVFAADDSKVEVYGGEYYDNYATYCGSAFCASSGASMVFYGGDVHDNIVGAIDGSYSSADAGAICSEGVLGIYGPLRVYDNTNRRAVTPGRGRNLWLYGGTFTITDGYFETAETSSQWTYRGESGDITGGYFGASTINDSASSGDQIVDNFVSTGYQVVDLSSDDHGDPYYDADFPCAVYRTTDGHSVAETLTITYGDDIPLSTTYSGLLSEAVDTVSWTETSNSGASAGGTGTSLPINAGTYSMNVQTKSMLLISGSSEDNAEVKDYYPSQTLDFTLQINRATVTADNFSYVEGFQHEIAYDGSAHYADIEFTGLQETDTGPILEVVYSRSSTSIIRETPIEAGTYYIFVTGGQTDNYDAFIGLNTGLTLTITREVAVPENTPEAITSCVDTLGEIDLSDYADENGYWSWVAPDTAITGEGGTFQAVYTPYDELVQGVTASVTIISEHVLSSEYSYDESGHWRDCLICGEPQDFETHTLSGSWIADGSDGHYRVCEVCGGHSTTSEHTYGNWTVDQQPTQAQSGSMHRECSLCGETDTVTLPALNPDDGFYDYEIITQPGCETTGLGRYTYETSDVTQFTWDVTIDATGHDWDGNWISDEDGHHYQTCNNDPSHTDIQDCSGGTIHDLGDGTHGYTCDVCGGDYNASDHNFTGWVSDGTDGHYRVCEDCGAHSGTVSHTFSSWEVTVEPTAPGTDGMGEETRVCSICGYAETRDLDYWDWYEGGEETEADNTAGELAGMIVFLLGDIGTGDGLWWSLKYKRFRK